MLALGLAAQFVVPGGASAAPVGVAANSPIFSRYDNRCLDSDTSTPTHNGTKVQIWDCNGRNNQKWTIGANGRIQSRHDGRCLDLNVSSPPTHNGTKVQVWACNGFLNQRWTYNP